MRELHVNLLKRQEFLHTAMSVGTAPFELPKIEEYTRGHVSRRGTPYLEEQLHSAPRQLTVVVDDGQKRLAL